jgi:SlyX protein
MWALTPFEKREATMSEDRLVDIEVKLAHQEQLLIDLNEVVTGQQAKIMQLEELCGSLVDRVRSIGEAMPGDGSQDERPPHY